jgi:hypothetical protein
MDTSDKYLVIAKYLSDVSIRSIFFNPHITANKTYIKFSIVGSYFWKGVCRLSKVRGSWKRRTFVTRKRAKFTGAFLLR